MTKSIVDILSKRVVPDHIKRDHPLFDDFIKAYFEYLEQYQNPHDTTLNFLDYHDIDRTVDDFVEYFRRELMVNIPVEILADKRLLSKQIKQFYLNKGNESSYRFLFRLLFNDSIEFYYPKTDILRASDGKWYQQFSLKFILDDVDLDLSNIIFKPVTGVTSGASALIESAILTEERGENVVEIILSSVKGEFQSEEQIEIESFEFTLLEVYNQISMDVLGSQYAVGDIFNIKDAGGNIIGQGEVKATTKGPVTGFTIISGGANYNGDIRAITRFGSLPSDATYNSQVLATSAVDGSDDSNHIDYSLYTENTSITLTNISGTGDVVTITDSLSSFGEGATARVNTVGNDGQIVSITLLTAGNNYDSPVASVESTTGSGANIAVLGGGGAIRKAVVSSFPIFKESDIDSNGFTAYPDFSTLGNADATGSLLTGPLLNYPGRFLNEDGFLSSNKVLQDNRFFQEFSYVIKTSLPIDRWREIISKIIHPAGLAVFGEIDSQILLDGTITQESNINILSVAEVATINPQIDETIVEIT